MDKIYQRYQYINVIFFGKRTPGGSLRDLRNEVRFSALNIDLKP